MMLLVTLSYKAEMCMFSSSLPASENSGAGARGGEPGTVGVQAPKMVCCANDSEVAKSKAEGTDLILAPSGKQA